MRAPTPSSSVSAMARLAYADRYHHSPAFRRKVSPGVYAAVVLMTGLLSVAQFYFLPNNLGITEFGLVALGLSVLQAALQFSDLGSGNASLRSDLDADLRVALRENAVSTSWLICIIGIAASCVLGVAGVGFGFVAAAAFASAAMVVGDKAHASAAVQRGDERSTTRHNIVWQNSPKLGSILGSFGGSATWAMAGGLVTSLICSRLALPRRPSWTFLRDHRNLWLPGLAVSLGAFVLTWSDTYLLSFMAGLDEAGQYQAVVRPLTGLTYLYLPLVALVQAAHNAKAQNREKMLTAAAIVLGIVGSASIAIVLVSVGHRLWPEFRFDADVVVAAAVASAGMCAATLVGTQLLLRGHHLVAAANGVAGTVVLVVVSVLTIRSLGALGAALASAAGWSIVACCHAVFLVRLRHRQRGECAR